MILGGNRFGALKNAGAETRAFIAAMTERCSEVGLILGLSAKEARNVVVEFGAAVVRQNEKPWADYSPSDIAAWWRLRGSKR
jgi:hypothetical protein